MTRLVLLGGFWMACNHPVPPSHPERKILAEVDCQGPTRIDANAVTAITGRTTAKPTSISPEASATPITSWLTVSLDNGELYFHDNLNRERSAEVFNDCKIDLASLEVEPIAGTLGADHAFVPTRRVLASLDSGFGIRYAAGELEWSAIKRPDYSSGAWTPYTRASKPRPASPRGSTQGYSGIAPAGRSGATGKPGQAGTPGGSGANGAVPGQSGGAGGRGGAGGTGTAGQRGSNASSPGAKGGSGTNGGTGGSGASGGRGGSGAPGIRGGDGAPGQMGRDGPALDITFTPVFSRFYPDETLVYASVTATDQERGQEELDFIFHLDQAFTFTSVGGRGGDGGAGGAGGRGGDGGNGGAGGPGGSGGRGGAGGAGGPATESSSAGPTGNGGDGGNGGNGGSGAQGGNGASGACGGNGGDGGRGGNGGRIRVTVNGPSGFRSRVLNAMTFASVPGAGGDGGRAGVVGTGGSAGAGGGAGPGGSGGSGGSGSTSGESGDDGKDGAKGKPGSPGFTPACSNRPGRKARPGASQRVLYY